MNRITVYTAIIVLPLLVATCGQTTVQEPPYRPSTYETSTPGRLTRVIPHAVGETQVPATPQRVVVLDMGELDNSLALGITPVGAATPFADEPFPSYARDVAQSMAQVGSVQAPDLEAIAQLDPDLIMSSELSHAYLYDDLSQIAPTVFSEAENQTWKEQLLFRAETLGKQDAARQLIGHYNHRRTAFRRAMGSRLAETQVSVVRFIPGQVRIYERVSFAGAILEDVGLARPPAQRDNVFITEASRDHIPDMDGDVLFISVYGPPEHTPLAIFQQDDRWQQLQAVRTNQVYEVLDDCWMLGNGILAADQILDDLERSLLNRAVSAEGMMTR